MSSNSRYAEQRQTLDNFLRIFTMRAMVREVPFSEENMESAIIAADAYDPNKLRRWEYQYDSTKAGYDAYAEDSRYRYVRGLTRTQSDFEPISTQVYSAAAKELAKRTCDVEEYNR